jgi:hypothetical protein
MLFYLIAGHALADFAWQSDAMATCKCAQSSNPLQKSVPWYYWLVAHALIHGGLVAVILRWLGTPQDTAIMVGIIETGLHLVIDHLKCRGWFGIAIDQSLHVACKVIYVIVLTQF